MKAINNPLLWIPRLKSLSIYLYIYLSTHIYYNESMDSYR